MAEDKSMMQNLIEISSSEELESESEFSSPESDEDSVKRTSSSTSCDDDNEEEEDDAATGEWIDSEDEEDDDADVDKDEDYVDKDDVESLGNKVIQMIRGRNDLHELNLVECKAYLRRHGLRLSGTKEDCIERIKEHLRLKDGNGETYYPRSSFEIDCTGDVCKGDVVLFNQKVHQIKNKMTSRSHRRRTVAGRIVKESYGAAKQQHTFTVEVLWSKGAKRLDPLTPLLVKGRNLYKMKTYRQRWENEKERLEVLAEKHKRGAAARTIRAMRNAKAVMKTKNSLPYRGTKRFKHSHQVGPFRTRETFQENNYRNERGKALAKNKKQSPRINSARFRTSSSKHSSQWRHQNPVQPNHVREPPGLPYSFPPQTSYHFQSNVFPREVHHFPSHRGFVSTSGVPYSGPKWKEYNHGNSTYTDGYSHSRSSHIPRNLNYFPSIMDDHPSFYSSNTDTYRWR
ncbi:hypothetical protein OROHE_002397 [Orobanche hederae]